MRKRWTRLAFAGGLLLLFLAALGGRRGCEQEPYYQGRSLSQWHVLWAYTVDKEDPASRAQAEQAAQAIRQIGTNAIPILFTQLKRNTSPLRERLYRLVGATMPSRITDSTIVTSLFYPTNKVEPSSTFVILGPLATPAVPELTAFLREESNPGLVRSAAYCLMAVGPGGFPPLLDALAHPELQACYETACWLSLEGQFNAGLGTNLTLAVPLLALHTASTNPPLAEAAIKALGRIRAEPHIALPALARCLPSTNRPVRLAAMRSLLRLDEQNAALLLNHPDDSVRSDATNFLRIMAAKLLTNAPAQ